MFIPPLKTLFPGTLTKVACLITGLSLCVLACVSAKIQPPQRTLTVICQAEPEVEHAECELPVYEQNLGKSVYQYYLQTPDHPAYFCLKRGGKELYKCASAGSFDLLAHQSGNRTVYRPQLSPDNFIIKLDDELIVVEELVTNEHIFHLISLSKNCQIAGLNTGDDQFALRDLNGSTVLSGSVALKSWGARTVCPQLNLAIRTSRYHFRQLKAKPLPPDQIASNAAHLKPLFAELISDPDIPITLAPPELADQMAQLIYDGNEREANQLLNLAWPKSLAGKRRFARELKRQIDVSSLFFPRP